MTSPERLATGLLFRPEGQPLGGVLVLAGSSGRLDEERASLLARHGLIALALQWFGGPGQPPGICEVPLETFADALTVLSQAGADRLAAIGVSKGAEAALLLTCLDRRVEAVVAISPSSVAWANVGPGLDGLSTPARSSWSWNGEPLPYVPYDPAWEERRNPDGRIAFRTLYESSMITYSKAVPAATVPIDHTNAEVVLVAGGDDESDSRLGALAWPFIQQALRLR